MWRLKNQLNNFERCVFHFPSWVLDVLKVDFTRGCLILGFEGNRFHYWMPCLAILFVYLVHGLNHGFKGVQNGFRPVAAAH